MAVGVLPTEIRSWLATKTDVDQVIVTPIGDGCTSPAAQVQLPGDIPWFIKWNYTTDADFFHAEAAGLAALATANVLVVPQVLHVATSFIVMRWLKPVARPSNYWSELGVALAKIHDVSVPHFGFHCDTFCGANRQPNQLDTNGYQFYQTHRYGFQARLARDQGWMSASQCRQVERMAQALPKLIPLQTPSLLHGDLWSGNIWCTSAGCKDAPDPDPDRPETIAPQAALIDPAVYFGWAEADLAMTTLFGAFDPAFYQAYEEHRPQVHGWRDRADIHHCYHLLNHANLFGGPYADQAMAIVNRYAD